MNNKKLITLVMLVLASVFLFCSCAAPADPKSVQRVNEALDKIRDLGSAHIEGTIGIGMKVESQSIDMNIAFDMTKTSNEEFAMSMHLTGLMSMDMEMYGTGGKYYMYSPLLSDKYIDATSQFKDQLSNNSIVDMSMFDFDAAATTMNFTEDSEAGTLKVDVNLNNEQMKQLIRKVYAEQNMGTGALSEQSKKNLEILESMNIDSAKYTIYLDKDNNITKFELAAKISMNYMGKSMKMDMTANYEVLETGDSVKVELPAINPDNVVMYEELLSGYGS